MSGFICEHLGGRFSTHGGSFWIRFWSNFNGLECDLETLGSPWAPKGGRVGKVTEKVDRGSLMGPPLGPPLEPESTPNREKVIPRSTLENIVRKVPHKRCSGPAPTFKIVVSSTRHRYLDNCTCSSETMKNCV